MISHEDARVSIDNGNAFVGAIKSLVKETFNQNVIGGIGSFAGAFKLPSGYKRPVILGAADGVGTKLRLAISAKRYDTIGQDLVVMCVNDLIYNFTTPLFFLDYYATAKSEVEAAKAVVEGITKGCKKTNYALVGGETAEISGMYAKNDFDLTGFAVGIAEGEDLERSPYVKNGDLLLALSNSGLHPNGYSLVREMLFGSLKIEFGDKIEGRSLIGILLEPTCIYVKDFLVLKPHINTLAYIIGGGLVENLPRVLLRGVGAVIRKYRLRTPEIFYHIDEMVGEAEMYRNFNMGVGLVLVVSPSNTSKMFENTDAFIIGEIVTDEGVILE